MNVFAHFSLRLVTIHSIVSFVLLLSLDINTPGSLTLVTSLPSVHDMQCRHGITPDIYTVCTRPDCQSLKQRFTITEKAPAKDRRVGQHSVLKPVVRCKGLLLRMDLCLKLQFVPGLTVHRGPTVSTYRVSGSQCPPAKSRYITPPLSPEALLSGQRQGKIFSKQGNSKCYLEGEDNRNQYQRLWSITLIFIWSGCIAMVSTTREWWRGTMWQAAPGTQLQLAQLVCSHQLHQPRHEAASPAGRKVHRLVRASAPDDPSVSQSAFTIREKAPPSRRFNQEKALVGAFSVIVQLHRLIVNCFSPSSGGAAAAARGRQRARREDRLCEGITPPPPAAVLYWAGRGAGTCGQAAAYGYSHGRGQNRSAEQKAIDLGPARQLHAGAKLYLSSARQSQRRKVDLYVKCNDNK